MMVNIRQVSLGILLLLIVILIIVFARGYGSFQQPIEFNHNKHVKKLDIECEFCHQTVAENAVAGIPNVEVCIFCHEEGVVNENPRFAEVVEIVREHIRQGTKIKWNRIYKIPDHVVFSHKVHVNGGVECESCHGGTGTSTRPWGKLSLISMGSCLSCHEPRRVSTDCLTCHK